MQHKYRYYTLDGGEPDFGQPKCVSDAAQKSILNGETPSQFAWRPNSTAKIANFYIKIQLDSIRSDYDYVIHHLI